MTYKPSNSHNEADAIADLSSIRLSPSGLAEARAELLRAEAIAEAIHRGWTASYVLAHWLKAVTTRKFAAVADRYSESAMRATMRQRDLYLGQATDTADLERRLQTWQMPRYAPHLN